MGDTPHELHAEFPEMTAELHRLKVSDSHASRLMDDYHALNREVHRIETNVAPASDETLETLKKKRLALKDEIFALLTKPSGKCC